MSIKDTGSGAFVFFLNLSQVEMKCCERMREQGKVLKDQLDTWDTFS